MRATAVRAGRGDAWRGSDLLMLVVIACCLAALAFVPALFSRTALGADATRTVKVSPGQTLWSIASNVRGGTSTAEAVAAIREANGLTSGRVASGVLLEVPIGQDDPRRADAR